MTPPVTPPAADERARPASGATRLHDFLPRYDFHEVHETFVRAPAERVFAAIEDVTPREIALVPLPFAAGLLGWEALVRRVPYARLAWRPLLQTATRTAFVLLAREPQRELVVGTTGRFFSLTRGRGRCCRRPEEFLAFDEPGCVKAALDFLVEPRQPGLQRVRTETRVLALDDDARRHFGWYWTFVRPGSGALRSLWLSAIRRRAERPPGAKEAP